jgi:parvulin-like peptidyl-prolyl isomerase
VGEARFSRTKPDPKLAGDVMLAALETPTGKVTEPVKTPQGVYVLRVRERIPADLAALTPERDKLTRDLLTQKQGQVWAAWIERARSQAKVELSPRPLTPRS